MNETKDILKTLSDIELDQLRELILLDKKKKKEEKKVSTKVQLIYQGKVTLTCFTCNNVYNEFFTANIPDVHLRKKAITCAKCGTRLLSWDKPKLIRALIESRRGTYKCIQ